jgi:hypothetical protein
MEANIRVVLVCGDSVMPGEVMNLRSAVFGDDVRQHLAREQHHAREEQVPVPEDRR